MRLWRFVLAVLLLSLGGAAFADPAFPPLTGRVVDQANVLSADQKSQIEQLSKTVEQASTRQLVVATVSSLQGYPIEDYGYKLGRFWKIGQQGTNNGIILLVAPTERQVRIEVGYGLEPIMTDALSSIIIGETITPKFKAGDMGGGILAGAQAIAEQLKLPPEEAEKRSRALVAQHQKQQHSGNTAVLIFWAVVILFVVLPLLFRRRTGQRYGGGGWAAPIVMWGGDSGGWGGGGGGGWSGGGGDGGGGGFSGGGGSFGGGGASGSW